MIERNTMPTESSIRSPKIGVHIVLCILPAAGER